MTEARSIPNQQLRHERERHAWSQQDVVDKVGTTPLNVGRWERGITMPSPYFRQKLCEIFEKSVQELDLIPEDVEIKKETEVLLHAPATSHLQETPPLLWNVPYNRNLFFTSREDILAQLHDAFFTESGSWLSANHKLLVAWEVSAKHKLLWNTPIVIVRAMMLYFGPGLTLLICSSRIFYSSLPSLIYLCATSKIKVWSSKLSSAGLIHTTSGCSSWITLTICRS